MGGGTRRDGLSGNQLMHMLCDRRGWLWFASLDGGVSWRDENGFHRCDEGAMAHGMAMFLLEDRDGAIWAAGRDMLCRWRDGEVLDLPPQYRRLCGQSPHYCYGMAQDASGDVWVGSDALIRFSGGTATLFGATEGLPPTTNVYSVGVDADGHIYVGCPGLVLRRRGDGPASHIFCLTPRRDGSIWFAVGEWGGPVSAEIRLGRLAADGRTGR